MGDAGTPLSTADARHLLRRATFGASPAKVQTLLDRYPTRGQAADFLLDFRPSRFRPRHRWAHAVQDRWIRYMVRTKLELQEKLVLFWHDHFATNIGTIGNPYLMAEQNRLLRENCKGDFRLFVRRISRDAAMMEFLDTVRNRKEQPNENYARELLELFTLGVTDNAGYPNYTQEDIVQIARAFTGWRYENWRKGIPVFRNWAHDYQADYPERGPKVIFRTTGGFGPQGRDFTLPDREGEAEVDRVIDIIFEHRDTEGHNTVARHIAGKVFRYFAHAQPSVATIDEIIASSAFDSSFDIAALLRALFVHDEFYATAAPAPFGAGTKKSVKWPADFVVSTLRLLGMRLKGREQWVNGGRYGEARAHLASMGQSLLEPPSVFGWDWEEAWLGSAALLARYAFVRDVTAARGKGRTAFRPERLVDLSLTDPGEIIAAAARVLGMEDQLGAEEHRILEDYLTDNGATPSVNLLDENVQETKLRGLFALLLQSPAYQMH